MACRAVVKKTRYQAAERRGLGKLCKDAAKATETKRNWGMLAMLRS